MEWTCLQYRICCFNYWRKSCHRCCPLEAFAATSDVINYMQMLEANERKVGKVRFVPTDSEPEEDLDNKCMNRVVSKRVVNQKRQTAVNQTSMIKRLKRD